MSRAVASCFLAVMVGAHAPASDWPMWRYDAGRTASSPERLPGELELQWERHYTGRRQVWQDSINRDLMPYDKVFEPVVTGKTLFLGFNDSDKLVAFDTETGAEIWAFYADGPVRLPPAARNGKVYFTSDDGCLYCLDARDGRLVWRFRGGPSERKVLGNGRLISAWPARGGPVVVDGRVYFAASIWPFMGTFLYALDAETGAVVWSNTGTGARYMKQPHNSPSFAGVAPQGALVAVGDRLLVPSGRSVPGCFDRRTGEFLYYHLAANGKTGGSFVCALGNVFFCHRRGKAVKMFDLDRGGGLGGMGGYPVLAKEAYYVSGRTVVALDRAGYGGRKGRLRKAPELWRLNVDASGDLIKAGGRLYAAGGGALTALELRGGKTGPRVAWKKTVGGKVERLVAADGKLFAVTLEGGLYCFGARRGTPRKYAYSPKALPEATDGWSSAASSVLKDTGAGAGAGEGAGYALVLGLKTGRLVEELVRRSKLHVIAVDPDASKVDRLRRRLDAAGLYGTRAAVHVGDPMAFRFPPYLASLVVSEDLKAAGIEGDEAFVEAVFRPLRPYGGKACLAVPPEGRHRFTRSVARAKLANAELESKGRFTLLIRKGALPGSGSWTHQYADSANTVVSEDKLVKTPLGLLWFGGPSHDKVLPRHGHGPSPQVVGGRLFIEGLNMLRAVDVYTGRLLWEKDLPNIGFYYRHTGHHPGANEIGSNYVSVKDGVYVVSPRLCLRLDPATGETVKEFALSAQEGEERPRWGFVTVWKDLLVAAASPISFPSGKRKVGRPPAGKMSSIIKSSGSELKGVPGVTVNAEYASASGRLVVMDRHSGRVLWSRRGRYGFRHNAIAVAAGKAFCIDGMSRKKLDVLRRRGVRMRERPALYALDARTGDVVWKTEENVFGTWLGYSEEHDVLLQAGSRGRDRARDELGTGMVAYRGRDGKVLWQDLKLGYSGPCMLHHGTIITQGKAFDLLTGKRRTRRHPLSGEEIEWRFRRNYGCNTAVASEHLLTFRSAAAGFYDLANDGGTGNFGGFKSGCTSNLIAADGVLNAPDYTRTCRCSYQNQTSLALVHMPDDETWTFNRIDWPRGPVRRMGINLGAPGDRLAENGTLWLDYPSVGGPSPKLPVKIQPGNVSWFRKHSSFLKGKGLGWVAASGARGISSLRIALGDGPERAYDLRLVFAEPDGLGPGERVFSVAIQGRSALTDFDTARSDGPDAAVIREFKSVRVKAYLEIALRPSRPGGKPPVLSGVEATAAGW